MGCLGVHFALPKDLADVVLSLHEAEEVADMLDDHFRELSANGWTQETDKAWDAIHRCLTDGKLEFGDGEEYLCVLGSGMIFEYHDGDEWIVNILYPEEVQSAFEVIEEIDEADFRRRYGRIDQASYGFPKSEDGFEYTWSWFVPLREFFRRAAGAGRCVVFLADQ